MIFSLELGRLSLYFVKIALRIRKLQGDRLATDCLDRPLLRWIEGGEGGSMMVIVVLWSSRCRLD